MTPILSLIVYLCLHLSKAQKDRAEYFHGYRLSQFKRCERVERCDTATVW